ALDRLELTHEATVQLELRSVRLKTGLKLLLDQLGLTYRVIPEDNLLVLTDTEGSEEPLDRVLSELKALHRDLHALQDAMDELLDYAEGSGGDDGQAMRVASHRTAKAGARSARSRRASSRMQPRR